MPELPEIQAHAERLGRLFAGRTLAGFRPLSVSVMRTFAPAAEEAVGRELARVGRRGKFLLLTFGAGPVAEQLTFVVHLMQAGRLVPDDKQAARPRNGLARWSFSEGSALLLTEAGKEHKAGIWVVAGDPLLTEPLSELGIEADTVTVDQLRKALRTRNQRLHGFLRDQHGIAGIGRLLANEICFRARLSPFAMTAKLDDAQIGRLAEAIHGAISDSLAHERTLDAMSKSAERPAAVHHRKGQPCPRCGDVIRAVNYNAYEVDYCATCQTGGKVLADNTTSKFLK